MNPRYESHEPLNSSRLSSIDDPANPPAKLIPVWRVKRRAAVPRKPEMPQWSGRMTPANSATVVMARFTINYLNSEIRV